MHAQRVSGFRKISVALVNHSRDEALLELALGVFIVDTASHHLVDELFEEPMHVWYPVRGR